MPGISPALLLLGSLLATSGPGYGLDMVHAPDVWNRTRGEWIVVAVVDSGVDLDHPDLAPHVVPGVDLVDGDDRPDDLNGHGTHVAGIVLGAAPSVSIMPVRVFDANGGAGNDLIAAGVDAAVERGADVINLSLGDTGVGDRLRRGGAINQAITRADAAGVVVVSAAGNDGQRETVYRNSVALVVVAAVGPDRQRAPFSNYGDERTVAAPGVDIVSTAPPEPTPTFPNGTDGTGTLSGTSMAAPFVAAEAALLRGAGIAYADVLAQIPGTAQAGDPTLGAGIVDFAAALADVPASTTTTTTAPPPGETVPAPVDESSTTTEVALPPVDESASSSDASPSWLVPAAAAAALAACAGTATLVLRRRR